MEAQADAVVPARNPRTALWPRLVAFLVLVAIGLVINFTVLAHHGPRHLDGPQVATLISQAMQAQSPSALASPPQVACATTEPVKQGYVFDCHLSRGATTVPVRVTETDDQGRFSWQVLGGPGPKS